MGNFRVFKDHQLLAEYPGDAQVNVISRPLDNGKLAIDLLVNGNTFLDGEYHAAGFDIRCGFVRPDPACERCHELAPTDASVSGGENG